MKKIKILSLFGSLVAAIALSGSVVSAEQIPATNIVKVLVYKTLTVIKLENAHTNADGCTPSKTQFIAVDISRNAETGASIGEAMNAAVMAAKFSGVKVGFGVAGCIAWGNETVPLVYRVDY